MTGMPSWTARSTSPAHHVRRAVGARREDQDEEPAAADGLDDLVRVGAPGRTSRGATQQRILASSRAAVVASANALSGDA